MAQDLTALQLDSVQMQLPALPGRVAQARQKRVVPVFVNARHVKTFPYRTTASNAAIEFDDFSIQMLEIMC
jgi:hypothetical protein